MLLQVETGKLGVSLCLLSAKHDFNLWIAVFSGNTLCWESFWTCNITKLERLHNKKTLTYTFESKNKLNR